MVTHLIAALLGILGGAISLYVLLEQRQRRMRDEEQRLGALHDRITEHQEALRLAKEGLFEDRRRHEQQEATLKKERAEFAALPVCYAELQTENALLKRDLRNFVIGFQKLKLDCKAQEGLQEQLDKKSCEVADRYLRDTVKWVMSNVTSNNYAAQKQRILDVVARCRDIGFEVTNDRELELLADLKEAFEKAVRAALEREEQARIKARIREEQRLQREIDRELQQAALEKSAIEAALARALAEARNQHTAEIELLQAKLAEAEARAQRALSMAQQTKAGNIYVISNIGSFGNGIFKVGMTRRLEPKDRIKELGDASVPFPFDVHMMISCDDAPKLETALHRALHRQRLNRMNPRREFFRTDIDTIRGIVERHHGVVDYVADPEALEYNQSLTMTDSDQEYVDGVYESMGVGTGESVLDEELE
ncbi:MAG: GIY-YIG nuclease family protein [Planctomycetaceae bacterium]